MTHLNIMGNVFGVAVNFNYHAAAQASERIRTASHPANDASIWLVCGMSGSGKSTIFNYLTQRGHEVSDSTRGVTNFDAMLANVQYPSGSVIENLSTVHICDTVGLGSSVDASSQRVQLKKEGDVSKAVKLFLGILNYILARAVIGVTGIIVCTECSHRVHEESKLLIRVLREILGPIPIIICITRCDSADPMGSVEAKFGAAQNWIDRRRDEILNDFGIPKNDADSHIVKSMIFQNSQTKLVEYHVEELVERLRSVRTLAKTEKLQSYRNRFGIDGVTLSPSAEQWTKAQMAVKQMLEDVQETSAFHSAVQYLAIPVLTVGFVVALPFIIVGGVGLVSYEATRKFARVVNPRRKIVHLLPGDPPTMLDDDGFSKCCHCHTDFTLIFRKHHCRMCGNVVCQNCAPSNNLMTISDWKNKDSQYAKPVRVCKVCKPL